MRLYNPRKRERKKRQKNNYIFKTMKVFTGKVIGVKQLKTATVSVDRIKIHPLYKKRFTRSTKYQVHDDVGVQVGNVVKFADCRPYSKLKKWKILKVVNEKKEVKK